MTNLAIVNEDFCENKHGVELKLSRMQELKQSIKALEAEFEMIKKDLVTTYFNTHDEYMNDKGLLLATYKESIRTQLNQTELKKNEPSIYDKYLELKAVKTFLLK